MAATLRSAMASRCRRESSLDWPIGLPVRVVSTLWHSGWRIFTSRTVREVSRERARQELEALKMRVEKGELQEPEKIGVAAATPLRRHHGHRYFAGELRQGKFHFFEHSVNWAREKALEGEYVIQTEARNLSPVEAVTPYQELNDVERGFSHLMELRPVYPQSGARLEAQVFVAGLAWLLD